MYVRNRPMGIPYFSVLCFIELHICCTVYKLMVCSNPLPNKCIGTIFQHLLSLYLSHFGNSIFQTFSLLDLLPWFVINDYNSLKARMINRFFLAIKGLVKVCAFCCVWNTSAHLGVMQTKLEIYVTHIIRVFCNGLEPKPPVCLY